MYALLSEEAEQEIISLDIFTPSEFGAILDYMYGQPLELTLEVSLSLSVSLLFTLTSLFHSQNAEAMFKIIRRLEMKILEQKCWSVRTSAPALLTSSLVGNTSSPSLIRPIVSDCINLPTSLTVHH
jgi:hypothetical protein